MADWLTACSRQLFAPQLWVEIQRDGYVGSSTPVQGYVQRPRRGCPQTQYSRDQTSVGAWWLALDESALTPSQSAFVAALIGLCTEIQALRSHALESRRMLGEHDPQALGPWVAAARFTLLRRFAVGMHADAAAAAAAVRAAITLPWSNGPVEGQVNRLKMLKRQMYGRAGFDLLRERVLPAA